MRWSRQRASRAHANALSDRFGESDLLGQPPGQLGFVAPDRSAEPEGLADQRPVVLRGPTSPPVLGKRFGWHAHLLGHVPDGARGQLVVVLGEAASRSKNLTNKANPSRVSSRNLDLPTPLQKAALLAGAEAT